MYPKRVKQFRKWAAEKIDKGSITDRATSSKTRRRGRRRKKRKHARKVKAVKRELV